MQVKKLIAVILLFTTVFSACKKDKDAVPETNKTKPQISNIEIGLNNNEIGTIGADFHFNMDVLAGDKIDTIVVKIVQRAGETYPKVWNHEVSWTQYRGAKNTNVHKHFDIPAEAAEGKYDFFITVYDQNGTKLEEKRAISLFHKENLPVNPEFYTINVFANDNIYYTISEGVLMPGYKYKKDSVIFAPSRISGIKGDGIAYYLLINKKHNHLPETVSAIDFNKAIVYGVAVHNNVETVGESTNLPAPKMAIGTTTIDNNLPAGNPITGEKAWESGTYYFGAVYTNTTYNMSIFHYTEIQIEL